MLNIRNVTRSLPSLVRLHSLCILQVGGGVEDILFKGVKCFKTPSPTPQSIQNFFTSPLSPT